MKTKATVTLLVVAGLSALLLFHLQSADAQSNGIAGFSGKNVATCNGCHFGGQAPTVTLSGPTTVIAGQTVVYELLVQGGQGSDPNAAAGLNVATDSGTLANLTADTQVLADEIAHTQPKGVDASGEVRFEFTWTAPITPSTTATLWGAGNSVNNNGQNSGDAAGTDTLEISVIEQPELTPQLYLPIALR